jgi:hypothetical protein
VKDLIWIKILMPAWSFIVNVGYWIPRLHKFSAALAEKADIDDEVKSMTDVREFVGKIIHTPDKFKDWRPWIITLIDSGFKDDCDGAAVFGKWLFGLFGIKGKIYSLRGKTGHAIFVTKDLEYMVTNDKVLKGKWTDSQIKIYFNLKYNRIIK